MQALRPAGTASAKAAGEGLIKKPRRVCRPWRQRKSKKFSAGACTWRKIHLRLQVWNLSPMGGTNSARSRLPKFVGKARRSFPTVSKEAADCRFLFRLFSHEVLPHGGEDVQQHALFQAGTAVLDAVFFQQRIPGPDHLGLLWGALFRYV